MALNSHDNRHHSRRMHPHPRRLDEPPHGPRTDPSSTPVTPGCGVSRRVFVRSGGIALLSLGMEPLFLGRAARAERPRLGGSHPVLVCLFQRGAADGLAMVVPHGDPIYYRERPRIAVPRRDIVDLDGEFGLHPRLGPLKPWWDDGTLAAIHAVGSPAATSSHGDAQDSMECGTPGVNTTRDGWANRYLGHSAERDATPFRAVAFGSQLPRALAGSAPSLVIEDLRTFGVSTAAPSPRDRLTAAFAATRAGAATGVVACSSAEGLAAVEILKRTDPVRYSPGRGAVYPPGRLGRSLLQIAQLIKADVGLELAFADVSGWDTHVNQGASQGQLATRLDELGQALAAFARDLGERMRDVVVVTMSEFGRTVRENGNAGTDHGHGSAMLVLGGPVRGGRVLGRWPGLDPAARFEGRDLAVTTDFRDVLTELLVRHLGADDVAPVFPGHAVDASRFPGAIRV